MGDTNSREVEEILLARRTVDLLAPADRWAFDGQRVLVTGAGGRVGTALASLIATCRPGQLTLFDHAESRLLEVERAVRAVNPGRAGRVVPEGVLGDVTRLRSVRAACRAAQPDVVFHAAGYSTIEATERSACAVVESNVFGTQNALTAAAEVGARFVFVSSAKAARPTSIAGAARRLAEMMTLTPVDPAFRAIVVRLGPILGGREAPVGDWLDRLADRQPLVIPHFRGTRQILTTREAAELCAKADLIGRMGETFWLETAPTSIEALAWRVMALGRVDGLETVPVEIPALPPGVELHETPASRELLAAAVRRGRLWSACQWTLDPRPMLRVLRALRHDVAGGDALSLLSDLRAAVPEFEPSRFAWTKAAEMTIRTPLASPFAGLERRLAS